MKPGFFLTLFVTAILITISCKEEITKPEELPAGRRDYVWTRDTLRADKDGFQFLSGIWGSSPNDVWVVGDAATYVNKVWHYDGTIWKNYLLSEYAEPTRVFGISSNEVWMVTKNSDIWRYNGTKWSKQTTIVPAGYNRILFEDIYGFANNIYAVGIAIKTDGDYTGIIVHYDGNKWEIVKTPQIKEYFLNVQFVKGGDVLIAGSTFFDQTESCRLYKLKDNDLSLVGKNKSTYYLGVFSNKCYISVDAKVYEYVSGNLVEVLVLPQTLYGGGIIGRSLNDFFCANSGWFLGHYDGTNLENLYSVNASIANGLIFEKEVFFILYAQVSTVLHGKLK
jgi:hypothetical protein